MSTGEINGGNRFEAMVKLHEKMNTACSDTSERGALSGRKIEAKPEVVAALKEANAMISSLRAEKGKFSAEEGDLCLSHIICLKESTMAIADLNGKNGAITKLCSEILRSAGDFAIELTPSSAIGALSLDDLAKGEESSLSEGSYVNLKSSQLSAPPLYSPMKKEEPKPKANGEETLNSKIKIIKCEIKERLKRIEGIKREPWKPHLHISNYRSQRIKQLKEEIVQLKATQMEYSNLLEVETITKNLEESRKALKKLEDEDSQLNAAISAMEEGLPAEGEKSEELKKLRENRREIFNKIYIQEDLCNKEQNEIYEAGKKRFSPALATNHQREDSLVSLNSSSLRGAFCENYVEIRSKHHDIIGKESRDLNIEGATVSLKTAQDLYRSTQLHLNGKPLFDQSALKEKLSAGEENENTQQKKFITEVVKELKSRGVSGESISGAFTLANQACFPHIIDSAQEVGSSLSGKEKELLIAGAENTHYNFFVEKGKITGFEVAVDCTLSTFDPIRGSSGKLPYYPSVLMRVKFDRGFDEEGKVDCEKGDILFFSWNREKGTLTV